MILLRKSEITNWWIAPATNKLSFCNIFSGTLQGNFIVVGFSGLEKENLYYDESNVVRIAKEGVFTDTGTFYPFTDAHELYLHFLIDANQSNTLIATNWAVFSQHTHFSEIVADIITPQGILADRVFDFHSNQKTAVLLTGYSSQLSVNIVLTPYVQRKHCIRLIVPDEIKDAIYTGSISFEEESIERRKRIRQLFDQITKGSYISVISQQTNT